MCYGYIIQEWEANCHMDIGELYLEGKMSVVRLFSGCPGKHMLYKTLRTIQTLKYHVY